MNVVYGMAKEKPATWLLDELRLLKSGQTTGTSPTQNKEKDRDLLPVEATETSEEVVKLVNRQLEEFPEVNNQAL